MRKIYRYAMAFMLMGASLCLQSCEDYFDLNENPNLVSSPPLRAMLSTATHKTGLNSQRVAATTSFFVQYVASPVAGNGTDTYQVTDYTSTWDALYLAMADIYDMKQKGIEEGASDYVGVANIMMSYHLSLVSDLWGDAPYSQAFDNSTLTPAFDSQQDLYAESLRLLDQGIAELNKTDSKVALSADNDLIHGGDKSKWIKTANAFKARLLNKISKQSSYNPAAVLTAVENSYQSNADDAEMKVFANRNPWAQIALNNQNLVLGGWLSRQLVNQLNGTTYGVVDPRLTRITDPTVTGTFVGTPNGTGNVGPANNTVRDEVYISRNSPLTGDLSPIIIASYAEMKFIEAEAAFRAGNRDRAYTAYLTGIRAHMDKLGVPPNERDAYLNNPAVAVGAANLTLALIFKEKYVVTYLNPEAWNDARRFDYQYAGFTLPVGADLPTFIRRVAYPQGESSKNPNTPNSPVLSDKLWWDR
ncbi:SusD/RagB family nutrient-binding outer membrane lipoprotein [Pontibacter sp. JH31]|uniref:SusD/RagB family nutrient-binding outer membrane lipoprotein n=1 Tax=Pontibacter aquaedesilientis TaxID=2766980 RepID=A0ABR7XIH3_9BACT|nr:SusD/RagB family nutrient-binding outer membrane lipoprotein [Pontibacter aquaedesilientis]MBD1397741.1 SusD/RagB family nutrient-binding outer membrane lipoprotein [Pontibacter aquaedesilientis]